LQKLRFKSVKKKGDQITFFNVKDEDIGHLVWVNYAVSTLNGAVAAFLAIQYHIFPLKLIIYVYIVAIAANLLLHLLLIIKAKKLAKDFALLLLALVNVIGLTAIIHYFPEARPSTVLVYIPSIVFSAIISLSFGITTSAIVVLAFAAQVICESLALFPYRNSPVDVAGLGLYWQIALGVSFMFLMILSFLSNYFAEVLRRREEQIKKANIALKNLINQVNKEKDKVSQEKDKTEAILYGIGDGVFAINRKGEITVFNQVAVAISGFSEKEAIGTRYDQIIKFIDEKTGQTNNQFIEDAMAEGVVKKMSNYTSLVRKDGEKVPISDSAAPLKDKQGQVIGCVVVFSDVTKERAIDKAKSEFVSLASHQLRTPLSTTNWYAEMMLAGDVGKLNQGQKKYLKEIYRSNQRMINLVSALLNVSRIELGTLAIEPELVDLIKMADSVLAELVLQINKKRIKLTKDYHRQMPKISADPNLMRIVFQNLLNNAVKYTPAGGQVGLSIRKEKYGILIKVADSGYGIPRSQQSRIFTKLFRADNVQRKVPEGTGLGLYIVKSIIDQIGGQIWFESQEGKGTTFFVVIPLTGMKKKAGSKKLNPPKA